MLFFFFPKKCFSVFHIDLIAISQTELGFASNVRPQYDANKWWLFGVSWSADILIFWDSYTCCVHLAVKISVSAALSRNCIPNETNIVNKDCYILFLEWSESGKNVTWALSLLTIQLVRMGQTYWRRSCRRYTPTSRTSRRGTQPMQSYQRPTGSRWRSQYGLCRKWNCKPSRWLPRRQRWSIRLWREREMGVAWCCQLGKCNVQDQLLHCVCTCQQFHWLDQSENVWQ